MDFRKIGNVIVNREQVTFIEASVSATSANRYDLKIVFFSENSFTESITTYPASRTQDILAEIDDFLLNPRGN